MAVDAHGIPVKVIITAGTTPDCKKAFELIEPFDAKAVFSDKAYDTNDIIGAIETKIAEPVIPPKANCKKPREFD